MIETMKEANKHLLLGFIYRFSDMATRIRDAIRNKEIGEVRSIRLIYIWDCHGKYVRDFGSPVVRFARKPVAPSGSSGLGTPTKDLNLRRDRFMQEGGPMIDCGVHQIDLARWWTGSEIKKFTAHGTRVDDDHACPDHVYIHMTHANGVHTMVESSFSYG